jgi:hypothetical protein
MAMKCFEVVRNVLEDTYQEIPGDEETRDREITAAIHDLSTTYTRVLTGGGPEFSNPVNRFAYVYAYVPAHAHWVSELIGWSEEAKAVFKSDKVRIACIGGGPGSDLVGMLKHLDQRGGDMPAIFCEIADGCELWKRTWADIGFTLDLPVRLNTDYVTHLVGDPSVWSHPAQFEKSDLFSMNFFVSEIAHLGNAAWDYIEEVLKRAKTGAVLLFNDNNDSRFFERFDEIASRVGWETLLSGEGTRKVYDPGEKKDELSDFRGKFGRDSRLTGKVAWRVLRKSYNQGD